MNNRAIQPPFDTIPALLAVVAAGVSMYLEHLTGVDAKYYAGGIGALAIMLVIVQAGYVQQGVEDGEQHG